jgi:hypothetical protein
VAGDQAIVDQLTTLVRPGGLVYHVDVDPTAPSCVRRPDMVDLGDLDRSLQTGRGKTSRSTAAWRAGCRADLELVEFGGRYDIFSKPRFRPPSLAARHMKVSARCRHPRTWPAGRQRSSRSISPAVPA